MPGPEPFGPPREQYGLTPADRLRIAMQHSGQSMSDDASTDPAFQSIPNSMAQTPHQAGNVMRGKFAELFGPPQQAAGIPRDPGTPESRALAFLEESKANPIGDSTVTGPTALGNYLGHDKFKRAIGTYLPNMDPMGAKGILGDAERERELTAKGATAKLRESLGPPPSLTQELVQADKPTPAGPEKPGQVTGVALDSVASSGDVDTTNPAAKTGNRGPVDPTNRDNFAQSERVQDEKVVKGALALAEDEPGEPQGYIARARAELDRLTSSSARKKVDALIARFEAEINAPNITEDKRSRMFKIMTEVVPIALLIGLGRMDVVKFLTDRKDKAAQDAKDARSGKLRERLGLAQLHAGRLDADTEAQRAAIMAQLRESGEASRLVTREEGQERRSKRTATTQRMGQKVQQERNQIDRSWMDQQRRAELIQARVDDEVRALRNSGTMPTQADMAKIRADATAAVDAENKQLGGGAGGGVVIGGKRLGAGGRTQGVQPVTSGPGQ